MALTNYLDPTVNPDVAAVAGKGGEALQLNADGAFSALNYMIFFVQTNFGIILTVAIILGTIGLIAYAAKKGKNKAMRSIT